MIKRIKISVTLDKKILKKLKDVKRETLIPISRMVEHAILEELEWIEKRREFYGRKK